MVYKLLLITDHFPPENSGGIGRPYSLYKYLPKLGYEIIVITKNSNGYLSDESNIFRVDSFSGWKQHFFTYKTIYRLFTFFGYRYFHIYSDLLWYNNVIKQSKRLLKDKKFDFIYSTFPSAEALKAGLYLHRKFNIPLISEFRDGLVFESIMNLNYLQKLGAKRLEKSIVEESSKIITIGQNLSTYFKVFYNLNNVYTVFNGFDSDDFKDLSEYVKIKISNDVKKRIVYFGQLNNSGKRELVSFFQAIYELKNEKIITDANFSLDFIGSYSAEEVGLVGYFNLSDIIHFCPKMKKIDGFKYIVANFDYLLFYGINGLTTIISSKLLEYLKLNMPIIGICKGNEAEVIINKTGTGETCGFDTDSIKKILTKVIQRQIFYVPNNEEISKFDRYNQACDIKDILEIKFN
jgi:hypothetical protein